MRKIVILTLLSLLFSTSVHADRVFIGKQYVKVHKPYYVKRYVKRHHRRFNHRPFRPVRRVYVNRPYYGHGIGFNINPIIVVRNPNVVGRCNTRF